MLRAVGYARVSTEEQAKEGQSVEHQEAKIRAYADVYDLEVIRVEHERGVSAKTLDRPKLRLALEALDRGEADGILITKLDRLSRSLSDWQHLINKYFGDRCGRKLWSVSDSIDTSTASGRLVLNMLMTVAQWEREIISERTRDELQAKIRDRSRCGKVLYGSAIDPADPRRSKKAKLPVGLVDHPGEAAAIALMLELRGEGWTLRQIAAELTRRGIPTKEDKRRWHHTVVGKILRRTPGVATDGQG